MDALPASPAGPDCIPRARPNARPRRRSAIRAEGPTPGKRRGEVIGAACVERFLGSIRLTVGDAVSPAGPAVAGGRLRLRQPICGSATASSVGTTDIRCSSTRRRPRFVAR